MILVLLDAQFAGDSDFKVHKVTCIEIFGYLYGTSVSSLLIEFTDSMIATLFYCDLFSFTKRTCIFLQSQIANGYSYIISYDLTTLSNTELEHALSY